MRERISTEWQGMDERPARSPRSNPTADAAIGSIIREERRERRARWERLKGQSCCHSCLHYCFWDQTGQENGCKNYDRPGYQQNQEGNICPEWKPCRKDGRFGT